MGGKSTKRVLVIEDTPAWQKLLQKLLGDVAVDLRCGIDVVTVAKFEDALESIAVLSYDCATLDNQLTDGKMAKTLLDCIAGLDPKVPVVVVSGVVDPSDVRDFFKDYEIAEFFWKNDFSPRQFRRALAGLLASVSEEDEETHRVEGRQMDWNTITSVAVSAISPYAAAFATGAATAAGKEAVEVASEGIRELWRWISQTVVTSDDESAREAWKDFKENPRENKQALIDTLQELVPGDDAVLRGYVEGLVQEVQSTRGAHLISLLDNPSHYTFNDLKRICGRVSPQWEGEVGTQTQESLARWVVNYAPTRNRQLDLVAAMLEVNPTVMIQ